jgi:hypothetical protein
VDEATATARLQSMTAWDSEPVLSADQLTALVAFGRRSDDVFRWITDDTNWAAVTTYVLNTRRAPITRNGHIYLVTTAGTSGAVEPAWPTALNATIADGTVVWTEAGGSWAPTYDLNAAAAEGWRWKAATVAGAFSFTTDSQVFNRAEINAMCLAMAEKYQKRVTGSIRQRGSLPIIAPPIIPVPIDDSFPV